MNKEMWIEKNILSPYENYLKKLSLNNEIYCICVFDGKILYIIGLLPEYEDFKVEYKIKFIWMFKITNLLS